MLMKWVRRLKEEGWSWKFLVSRLLWKTGMCKLLCIKRDGYYLRFHPTALSCSLWYQPNSRDDDLVVLHSLLSKGDTYIDIGANIGDMALFAKSIVGDDGKVIAVEPHPKIFQYLIENIEFNQVNIKALQVAVGDSERKVQFSDFASDDQNFVSASGSIDVKMTTLDKLLTQEGNIKLLKIDIEGYEYFALLGGEKIISHTQNIYFEVWNRHLARTGIVAEKLLAHLTNKGFALYTVDTENKLEAVVSARFEVCQNLLATKLNKKSLDEIFARVQQGRENAIFKLRDDQNVN